MRVPVTQYLQKKPASQVGGKQNRQYGSASKWGAEPRLPIFLQPKLAISQPGDPHEQEADRVADQVMRMPVPTIQRQCAACASGGQPCSACEQEEPVTVSRKAQGAIGSDAPASVGSVIRSPGQPLTASTRTFFEPRFGQNLSHVRVHMDQEAQQSARDVNALAYTVGHHVVFGADRFAPETESGRKLIAHELTHVVQQAGASRSTKMRIDPDSQLETEPRHSELSAALSPARAVTGSILLQRTPAAPKGEGSTAVYDRDQVGITPINDIVAVGGSTIPQQTVTATITAAGASHLSWELYDPADKLIKDSSTVSGQAKALTLPFTIEDAKLRSGLVQGRYRLRCVAHKDKKPLAYNDQTFFVKTSKDIAVMDRTELKAVGAAPTTHSLGEVGAAKARDMMLEHQQSIASNGTGTVQGNRCTVATAGVAKSDCTQYVYAILKYAFGAKGEAATWKSVATEASRISGSGGLRGTALQKALETEAGWKGVFWAPSPRNPEDGTSEHPAAYKRVRNKGLYSSDDVAVDNSRSVIDYRPKAATKEPTFTRIDQLKKVPLGVISARGGTHMTLIINGEVYEVHWDKPANDPNVIQATPLEKWQWQSGAIVMPDADFNKAFP